MKRNQIPPGEYKNGVLVSGDAFLTKDDISLLLGSCAHLYRGSTKDMALIKFGAFLARMTPEALDIQIEIARQRNIKVEIG